MQKYHRFPLFIILIATFLKFFFTQFSSILLFFSYSCFMLVQVSPCKKELRASSRLYSISGMNIRQNLLEKMIWVVVLAKKPQWLRFFTLKCWASYRLLQTQSRYRVILRKVFHKSGEKRQKKNEDGLAGRWKFSTCATIS